MVFTDLIKHFYGEICERCNGDGEEPQTSEETVRVLKTILELESASIMLPDYPGSPCKNCNGVGRTKNAGDESRRD